MRTVVETAEAVRRGETSAVDVLEECLQRVDAVNPKLNAFVHLDPEAARRAAAEVDKVVAAGGDPGPLAGVPFGVKDLEDCAGMPTSHGSLLFKGGPPAASDSVHVARLRAAGAVPVGKTAAPEFGATAFTSTRAWGTTRNPWNPDRTPGGSSGGSAAAVAAGALPFCTASDGGGSTRIPAGFSGLVGFKASYGRIPHPANDPSATTALGALVTTVTDAARHLDVAAGPDDRDRSSLPPPPVRYEGAVETLNIGGLRAVWSPDLGFAPVEPEVAALAEEAARALVAAAGLREVDHTVKLTDPVRVWLSAGAADMWVKVDEAMYEKRSKDLDRGTRKGFAATRTWTVPRYARAHVRRSGLEAEVAELFTHADLLLTPTTAVPAFAADGHVPRVINGVDVHPAMAVPFTMVANLCWNPSLSVPAGLTGDGLPVGLMITGRRHHDGVVLRAGRLFEQARPWPRTAPGW